MTGIFGWVIALLLHPPQEAEMSERLDPPGLAGKLSGGPKLRKLATRARCRRSWRRNTWPVGTAGAVKFFATVISLFRLGDARVGRGYFPDEPVRGAVAEQQVLPHWNRRHRRRRSSCIRHDAIERGRGSRSMSGFSIISARSASNEFVPNSKTRFLRSSDYCHRVFGGANSFRLRYVTERKGASSGQHRDDRESLSLSPESSCLSQSVWGDMERARPTFRRRCSGSRLRPSMCWSTR